jgi:hypothetical protein
MKKGLETGEAAGSRPDPGAGQKGMVVSGRATAGRPALGSHDQTIQTPQTPMAAL